MENKKTRKKRVFKTENPHYSYGMKDEYNIKIMRVSRWIMVDYICITKKSRFWDYADSYTEENGKRLLPVFRYNDRLYALGQFMRFDSTVFYMDENGNKNFISGYDCTDYFYPLLVEISSNGEYVRLYRNLKENEYKENGGMY